MSVVLQDEASGAATGGVLYLTNIHRLYDNSRRRTSNNETYSFMGPPVSRANALDTGAELRDRITSHERIMVLNDEAHHVWDPDSAWNEAIQFLHSTVRSRTGGGIVTQLDFTATPKDNKGQPFKHIVCDAPLGEAVDAGIVKTPIIGKADRPLHEEPSDNAAYQYDQHLRLGYERWKRSRQEWENSGKKALLFVMCDDTEAADQITTRLNTDEAFQELNGHTINLHTNLKGKLKKVGKGTSARVEFVEDEGKISDDDLKALRELSRKLDDNSSQYYCIVSVLMLREGWDVRNVTTIVPLRPYSSKANILPEQTLGRGLLRMSPPGKQGANETVVVVEHPAFASLYQEQLAQEGLPIEVTEIDQVPATTVSVYPDEARKDLQALEIAIPTTTPAHRTICSIDGLSLADVQKAFKPYRPLPLGSIGTTEIEYEGRHLLTGEIVEKMKLDLPLLDSGIGAVSYYTRQIEQICRVKGLHQTLAPLIQTFFEEIVFERKASLFDPELVSRLGDSDVAEHLRAVFVPLVRARTIETLERLPGGEPTFMSHWRPFQVTHSERRPAIEASRTLFNLVPCNRELEVALARYADRASDVAAFAKNAGPQSLRIDYLAAGGRLAFYTPDFFVRAVDGACYLVETKGREDRDVPRKARAAVSWCESASKAGTSWEYVYIPQGVFERLRGSSFRELVDSCRPALQNLFETDAEGFQMSLFAQPAVEEDERISQIAEVIPDDMLSGLPPRYSQAIEQSVILFRFMEGKEGMNFAPVFNSLLGVLDEAAKGFVVRKLSPHLPALVPDQKVWFEPYLGSLDGGKRRHYESLAQNLKKTLIFGNGVSPMGLLRNCLDYALNDSTRIPGVFESVKQHFRFQGGRDFLDAIEAVYGFRNTRVAHQEEGIMDAALAKNELVNWVKTLKLIHQT